MISDDELAEMISASLHRQTAGLAAPTRGLRDVRRRIVRRRRLGAAVLREQRQHAKSARGQRSAALSRESQRREDVWRWHQRARSFRPSRHPESESPAA